MFSIDPMTCYCGSRKPGALHPAGGTISTPTLDTSHCCTTSHCIAWAPEAGKAASRAAGAVAVPGNCPHDPLFIYDGHGDQPGRPREPYIRVYSALKMMERRFEEWKRCDRLRSNGASGCVPRLGSAARS
jgi:hypothetical protein